MCHRVRAISLAVFARYCESSLPNVCQNRTQVYTWANVARSELDGEIDQSTLYLVF